MGTYSDFSIGDFTLETSGNFNTTTHHAIYLPKDRRIVERDYGFGVQQVEVYSATLGSILQRLEFLGATLPAIAERFANPYVTYDEPHNVTFKEALELVRQTDLTAIPPHDSAPDQMALLPAAYQDRLQGPPYLREFRGPAWDLTTLLERLQPYDILRLLAERPENHDLMVTWDFMAVVEAGYFERKDFSVGSPGMGYLLVTEGTSDTDIIRHAFSILRPGIADFFSYVDMEKNYPFGGHGSLVNFMKGLSSIGRSGSVLAIFDNDAAGVGALQTLEKYKDVNAIKLPDLEEFRRFPAIGPGGEQVADINGRAAAIECYLELPLDCRIRWTNYDPKIGEYQGSIDQKDADKSAQRDRFLKLVAGDPYCFDKIEKVLDAVIEACLKGPRR